MEVFKMAFTKTAGTVKTVIFDWDGTLHDTTKLYGNAFRVGYKWLVDNGYAKERYYSDADAAEYIGYSAVEMWKIFMPHLSREVTDIPNGIVAETMVSAIKEDKAVLYDGALDVLSQLKKEGYKLAFLSNCRISYMEAHRKYFDLDKYFDRMYNCEAFGWANKVSIFDTLKKELPGSYIMVGDRLSDLEVAYAHGFASIGCSYGFGSTDELKNASRIAADVRELPALIHELS